jgi:hypothetical protein
VDAAVLPLRQQRCLNHPQREASARCPECGRFYCRECITEHDDRVLCAACLARLAPAENSRREWWGWLPRVALALLAGLIVFLVLLIIGNLLLSIPSQFHDAGGG